MKKLDFSELTIRLLLIFFPGIIAALVINSLTTHKKKEFNLFLLYSFILGLTSYFGVYLFVLVNNMIVNLNGYDGKLKLQFLESLTNGESFIQIEEVLITTVVAFLMAIGISAILNRGTLHKWARKLKITSQFGENDVWQHTFNSPDIEWVTIRDFENDLIYQGYLGAFSDTFTSNELLLSDVVVYSSSTAEELYRVDAIYLTRNAANLTIEFQKLNSTN